MIVVEVWSYRSVFGCRVILEWREIVVGVCYCETAAVYRFLDTKILDSPKAQSQLSKL